MRDIRKIWSIRLAAGALLGAILTTLLAWLLLSFGVSNGQSIPVSPAAVQFYGSAALALVVQLLLGGLFGAVVLRTHDGKLEITWTEDGEQRALTADLQGARTAGELVYRYDREIITKTSSSAWWDEQGRLQMSVLWVESEAENRYMFTFDGDEVRVDKWFTFGTFKGLEKDECVYRRA